MRARSSKAQGYKIKKFKVDGNCYEIYGHNKEGKKVEIYLRHQDARRREVGNRLNRRRPQDDARKAA